MRQDGREEIVVIGGGLGGCLSALMIAKNPKFHVTLLEARPTLLDGASLIASRLHLGGEYPKAKQTPLDCLQGAILWKLLMPGHIYTPVPPIKYFIARQTHELGQWGDPEGLTVGQFEHTLHRIRDRYEEEFIRIQRQLNWDHEQTSRALFGDHQKGKFFRRLLPIETMPYERTPGAIAGAWQTSEIGINPIANCATLIKEVYAQENITVRTNCRVLPQRVGKVGMTGISGHSGNYYVHCGDNRRFEDFPASQVIVSAWEQTPSIIPLEQGTAVGVYKRAMLLVDLPPHMTMEPFFKMLGQYGCMFSPYNEKTAVCYIPGPETAYLDEIELASHYKRRHMPGDWYDITDEELHHRAINYFHRMQEHCPELKQARNPRVIVRDTLNFQTDLTVRKHQDVAEAINTVDVGIGLGLSQLPTQQQIHEPEMMQQTNELHPGIFVVYPTKATYAVNNAIQAALMVEERSVMQTNTDWFDPKEPVVAVKDTLGAVLADKERWDISHMQKPNQQDLANFYRQHPEVNPGMYSDTDRNNSGRYWRNRHDSKSNPGGFPHNR